MGDVIDMDERRRALLRAGYSGLLPPGARAAVRAEIEQQEFLARVEMAARSDPEFGIAPELVWAAAGDRELIDQVLRPMYHRWMTGGRTNGLSEMEGPRPRAAWLDELEQALEPRVGVVESVNPTVTREVVQRRARAAHPAATGDVDAALASVLPISVQRSLRD